MNSGFRLRCSLLLILASVLASGGRAAQAQSISFGATVSRVALLPPPFPSTWRTANTLITMAVTNSASEPVLADLQISISRGGVVVGSTPALPRTYNPGYVVYPTQLITDWSRMAFTGDVRKAVDGTGRLPDGTYTICADFTNVRTQSGILFQSFQTCTTYLVFFPKPPTLIFPENGSIVSVPQPVFQWTPVMSQVGLQLPHWFRLVEMLPGQTAPQAIEANRPIYEALFNKTSAIPYPASAPLLVEGRTYAWRVQAAFPLGGLGGPPIGVKAFGAPPAIGGGMPSPNFSIIELSKGPVITFGENDGKSRVYTFTWVSDPMRAAKLREARTGSTPADARVGTLGDERYDAAPGDGASAQARTEDGNGGVNFADNLIHALVSLWRPGAEAASAASRSGHERGTSPASQSRAAAGIERVTDTRLAQAPGNPLETADSTSVSPLQPGAVEEKASPDSAVSTPSVPEVVPAGAVPAETPTAVSPAVQPTGVGPNWARLHGATSLTGETYSRDGSGAPTRPDHSARVVTGLTVGVVGDRIQVPVSALVSGDQVRYRQNINQLAIAPHWQWAGLTAGNLMPQFSSYTLADATLLGGGFELNPSHWRLGFASGRARKAITPTPEYPVSPQFARNMTAGRIGYGDPGTNSVEVSVLRATDDAGSLGGAESTLAITPEANTVYSAKLQGAMPVRHLRAQLETALSKYDRDRRSNASSLDGHALGLQVFHETGLSRLGVKAEYLNGGFKTLGNTGITGDRLELGANARVQMLKGKLSLDGIAGLQNEGVNTSAIADTRRRSYGLNGSWQPGLQFGTDAQLSLYTSESDGSDSLLQGTRNTTRMYAISPHTTWNYAGIQHSVSCSAMLQKSKNVAGVTNNSTESLTLFANWALGISPPWTVTVSGNYSRTDFQVSVSEVSSVGPGFSWAAFRSRVLTNAQVQIVRSRNGNSGTDYDVAPRMETRWEFAPHQAIVVRGNYRHFKYANGVTPLFDERTASLEYVTNL